MKKEKLILAIETSCDETAAAVLSVGMGKKSEFPKIQTLSSIIKSQINIHSLMGGVVPEAAARAHIKNILPVVQKALRDSSFALHDLDYVAVTTGPGLMPSLAVGVEFAKGLSFALNKPIIPINHMAGHLYSPLSDVKGQRSKVKGLFPIVSLLVSGGHTMLVLMTDEKKYKVLGQTVDDAAGEAFDKVAKLLGLPYPGGPEISRLAMRGNASAINFPRPMIHHKNYNFSFSGLKTAVLYYVQSQRLKVKGQMLKTNICASFQQAVVDVLVSKTLRAAKEFKAQSISLSGGVAANTALRDELNVNCQRLNVNFFAPEKNLCTDNAEMIGIAAAFMLHNGYKPKPYKHIMADSNLEL